MTYYHDLKPVNLRQATIVLLIASGLLLIAIMSVNPTVAILTQFRNLPPSLFVVLLLTGSISLIVILLLMFSKPQLISPILALVLPFEVIPILNTYGFRDLDLITPILLLAILALLMRVPFTKLKLYRTQLEVPVALFLVSAFTAAILSYRPAITMFSYVKYSKVFFLMFLLFALLRKASEKDIARTLVAYVTGATIVGVYSIIAYVAVLLYQVSTYMVLLSPVGTPRIRGTLRDANIAAAYYIPVTLLCLYWLLRKRSGWAWYLTLAAFLISLTNLVLTVSRSGILGFAIAGLVWFALIYRVVLKKFSRIISLAMIVLLFVVALIAFEGPRNQIFARSSEIIDRLTGSSWDTAASNVMHTKMAEWAIEAFKANPWGVGRWNLPYLIGLDRLSIFGYTTIEQVLAEGPPVHSSWLEILVSEGVGGIIAFIWIIVIVFRSGWFALRKRTFPWNGESAVLTASFCGILISMIFYTYDWMYFVWFLIGLQQVFYFRSKDLELTGIEAQ